MSKFTISEAVHFGWEKTKKHFSYLLVVMLGAVGAIAIIESLSDENPLLGILSVALGILIEIGLLRLTFKILNDEHGDLQDFMPTWRMFWNYLFTGILYALIVLGGLILLIVPGVIWGIKFSQSLYLVVDKDLGIKESLKESARITEGRKMDLFLFFLSMLGIALLGAMAFFVGLIVALPVVAIAGAYVYRKLSAVELVAEDETPAPAVVSTV